MSSSCKRKMNTAVSWFFLLYFVILFFERTQSLIRITSAANTKFLGTAFNGYVNIITVLSLAAALIMLIAFNKDFWLSLVNNSVTPNYSMLTVTAGVILVSGMVHTEFTVPPIQFTAYGMLIVAMILRTVEATSGAAPFKFWYSLIYLTVFSMAIPVMYHSDIKNAAVFHVIEAVTALVLVACFTFMLREMFLGNGENLLYLLPIIIAVVCDTVILAMRWKESVNSFVLIFVILSAVLFAAGKILFAVIK